MKADGSLDIDASARKSAEGYSALEKRLGSGDVPPASPGEYKINAPDALKDAFKPEDPGFQKFLTDAHAVGMTQKQIDASMGAFFAWAPQLMEAQAEHDHDTCISAMKEVWTDPSEFKSGMGQAVRALKTFGGERFDNLAAKYGNDPDMIWLMANVGKELKEDRTVEGPTSGGSDISALQTSEAYLNPKHPNHLAVSAQVAAHYRRTSK